MLKFQAFNVLDHAQLVHGVHLTILQSDQNEAESLTGHTDHHGAFSCQGLMFKQIHIHAKKKGFLNVTYDFDVKANSTGSLLNIPMIPDYFSLINQYHILIYIPDKANFHMNYYLKCPDGTIISNANKHHKSLKVKLETVRLSKQSSLMNFQVHVQSLDPFIPQNKFAFFVENQKS